MVVEFVAVRVMAGLLVILAGIGSSVSLPSGSIASMLGVMYQWNSALPVAEGLGAVAAVLAVWTAVTGYAVVRDIRHWLPFV